MRAVQFFVSERVWTCATKLWQDVGPQSGMELVTEGLGNL